MAAAQATLASLEPTSATKGLENTSKRDALIEFEKKYQQQWADARIFEANAPKDHSEPKFFGTMAFPYVNGSLHLGHSFTASKVEFAAGWARMKGCNVLYPQGYHATGMPIKACADKITREIELFGQSFERCPVEDVVGKLEPEEAPAPTEELPKEDLKKFKGGKSKAAAKVNVALKYQFQIMLSQGIPLEEIHKFADPLYWLQYFPPIDMRDLSDFGCRIDWRRSFITTDANPYYDSFVQWQIQKLRNMGKIKFGKRYTVYSPKDGQACMDHDRADGEGIGVQEYTALKLKVVEWAETAKEKVASVPKDANVYFVPATLRPETMYGQICCFVGPSLDYGIYRISDQDYYLMTPKAARNIAFQNITAKWGEFPEVARFTGADVIGTKVTAPLSILKTVYILPMETVKAAKGTGVVTCVPSDSPDDWATMIDLQKKADYYKIKKEWIDVEVVSVIETPTYGKLTAKALVEKLKINSPKDAKQLAEAKEIAYREGFYKGKMIIGDFEGEDVITAKDKVRQQLLDSGDAFNYAEPDGYVLSRSGDECVAGHLDQWYMNYGSADKGGDGEWQQTVVDHVLKPKEHGGLNTFSVETKNALEASLNWLGQWACARSYGLGTKVPFSQNELVESLSDSTIYMSYYTFCHLLHKDIFGKEPSHGVRPEQCTAEFWDYVLTNSSTKPSGISDELLDTMRREFNYWYPLDFRCSGKDLITNHLTFFLYVHIALFEQKHWPRGIRINGHLQLNGSKMSKSSGNFLTLHDCLEKFGATATRIALADAGDGLDDANFAESVANNSILRMYELRVWLESMILKEVRLVKSAEEYRQVRDSDEKPWVDGIQRTGADNLQFWDQIFADELNGLVKATGEAYERHEYKAALKSGLYDFTGARDAYRETCKAAGIGMHQDLILLYTKYQALMIAVVAPHWSEAIWKELCKQGGSIQNARFPQVRPQDPTLVAAREYVRTTSSNITSAEGAQMKKLQKGKSTAYDPKAPKVLSIYVASSFPKWQDETVEVVRRKFDAAKLSLDVKAVASELPKAATKKAMPYVQLLKRRLEGGEAPERVWDRKLPFGEASILGEMTAGLLQTIPKCERVEIIAVEEGGNKGKVVHAGGSSGDSASNAAAAVGQERTDLPAHAEAAEPGRPQFAFTNV